MEPQDTSSAFAAPDAVTEPIIGRALFEFVTGPAGSGKTYAAREYMDLHAGEAVLTSSTGISAVNCGATTINSLLGYFDEDSLRDKILAGRVQGILRRLREAGITRIILDEVSMISAETLNLLTFAFDEVNGDLAVTQGPEAEREGLMGLTLVGDFCQLPPVPKADPHHPKKKLPVVYAFESSAWARFTPHILALTRVWRQEDPAFVEALRAARRADVAAVVAYFTPFCQLMTDMEFNGMTIFGTNAEVDRWNQLHHGRLHTKPHTFSTVRWGQQKGEWKAPEPGGRGGGHIPDHVGIRPGARVMILANEHEPDRSGLLYSNGDLGIFEGTVEQEVLVGGEYRKVVMAAVRLQRTGELVGVPPVTRLWETPSGALGVRKPKMEILGRVTYMPLRLAYASTVHKTQGLSMDAVQVVMAHAFMASPAMLYVAMSRARSTKGLRLVGTPQLLAARCTVDPKVLNWL